MRLFHYQGRTHSVFDDEHVIAYAGMVPVMRLAERNDLGGLVGEHVAIAVRGRVNAPVKVVGHITVHLSEHCHWQDAWMNLFDTVHDPPPVRAA